MRPRISSAATRGLGSDEQRLGTGPIDQRAHGGTVGDTAGDAEQLGLQVDVSDGVEEESEAAQHPPRGETDAATSISLTRAAARLASYAVWKR